MIEEAVTLIINYAILFPAGKKSTYIEKHIPKRSIDQKGIVMNY